MHTKDISTWRHAHLFHAGNQRAERRTWVVVWITLAMMTAEIVAGVLCHSMALLADGWHMGTHAGALGIAALAYVLARRHAADTRYAFGTWKIEILGGFASAVLLGAVAVGMVYMSADRLLHPQAIRCNEALVVAVIGLAVNLVCAAIIGGHDDHHDHDHDRHGYDHAHHAGRHADLNLRAAYLHVVADALTSVLAIIALLGAKYAHWQFLDPLMGIVGAVMIIRWTYSLLSQTSGILLDREMDSPLVGNIRKTLEADADTRISDIHLWRVGQEAYACVIALVASQPRDPVHYKALLNRFPELVHITIEPHACSTPDNRARTAQ